MGYSSIVVRFPLIFNLVKCDYDSWLTVTSPSLPRASTRQALGYDNVTNTIWMVAGYDGNYEGLVSFNVNDNTFFDYGRYFLSTGIDQYSQYYTQIDNILWIIDDGGTQFHKFDVRTGIMTYNIPSITIPNDVSTSGCLSSYNDKKYNNKYLIVLYDYSSYIYNLTSNTWLSYVPPMTTDRSWFACNALNEQIYAIAGSYENSIEVLNINSDIDDIGSKSWSIFTSVPYPALTGHISVLYQNDIIIFGGQWWDSGASSWKYNDQIIVIDTLTNTLTIKGALHVGVYRMSPIVVYPRIYVFGGDNGTRLDLWQYHMLPTFAPTTATINPTSNPTKVAVPTPSPTANVSPSVSPSIAPSKAPSAAPTDYEPWTTVSAPSLPRASSRQALGYDNITSTIWMVAGYSGQYKQLVSFNVNDKTFYDYGWSFLSDGIDQYSQYYTQIDNILWILSDTGTTFHSLDVRTGIMSYDISSITIPYDVSRWACLTQYTDSNDNNYLMVMGGYNFDTSSYLKTVFVFNMTSNAWLSNVPIMTTTRNSFSCNALNEQIYAIAGSWENSIEVLNVNDDINNIDSKSWNAIGSVPYSQLSNTQAVIYENDIIIIGGYYSGNYNDKIYVIDTLTNTLSVRGSINIAIYRSSAILVYPNIYVFGGDNGSRLPVWQYHTLHSSTHTTPTSEGMTTGVPTEVPTEAPTQVPTGVPIRVPTGIPTRIPTHIPTEVPTEVPTGIPTGVPTQVPTGIPTEVPTRIPTHTTGMPTGVPTEVPTEPPIQIPTEVPTEVPIRVPTGIPTRIPTHIPTEVPPDVPTHVPTEVPTGVTTVPSDVTTGVPQTATQTTIPSNNQTSSAPTSNPITFDLTTSESPTLQPTNNATRSPTWTPSSTPYTILINISGESVTNNPTEMPLINTKPSVIQRQTQYTSELDKLQDIYELVAGGFLSIFIIITMLSFIDAKLIRTNDYFRMGAIFIMMIQSIDMMSDCFFASQVSIKYKTNITLQYQIVFYASIACIVIPSLVALFQLYFYIKNHWLKNEYLNSWLIKHFTILLILSILTGSSFAAVSLLNSHIFQINLFDMGLTNKQLNAFNTRRIYSVVLLENVPQLILQCYYIYLENTYDNAIAISSILFSIISIIVSTLKMTMQKTIYNTQQCMLISMKITGKCVQDGTGSKKCRTIKDSVQKHIARLIGVETNNTELIKPKYVSYGLQFNMYIYVNYDGQHEDIKRNQYREILTGANDNGRLPKIFEMYWELSDMPKVTDIECNIIEQQNMILTHIPDTPLTPDTNTIDDTELVHIKKQMTV